MIKLPEHDSINLSTDYTPKELQLMDYWLEQSFMNKLQEDYVIDSVKQTNERREANGQEKLSHERTRQLVALELKEARKAEIHPKLIQGYKMATLPINPEREASDVIAAYNGLKVWNMGEAMAFAKGVRIADHRREQLGMQGLSGLLA